MKLSMVLAVAAALCPAVSATCANDCSGHGACNIYSSCDCYRNWMGADCSQRVCYFGIAFVDTPQGDLNADGLVSNKLYDARFTNEQTWEVYPWYAGYGGFNFDRDAGTVTVTGDSKGEGHFYTECSSKGICNRATGTCECFPGFTAEGCSRTTCANDCSGHGLCRRVGDLQSHYAGWDALSTQSCVCDSGYAGADCSLKTCPAGNDPVTKYTSFTRIRFREAATGVDHFDTEMCPTDQSNLATASHPQFGPSPNRVWDFRPVGHPYYANGWQWNAWYSQGAVQPNLYEVEMESTFPTLPLYSKLTNGANEVIVVAFNVGEPGTDYEGYYLLTVAVVAGTMPGFFTEDNGNGVGEFTCEVPVGRLPDDFPASLPQLASDASCATADAVFDTVYGPVRMFLNAGSSWLCPELGYCEYGEYTYLDPNRESAWDSPPHPAPAPSGTYTGDPAVPLPSKSAHQLCTDNTVWYGTPVTTGHYGSQWSALGAYTEIQVTGSTSQATGIATLGCCTDGVCASPAASECDFWSLYLKDTQGQFQHGDVIEVSGSSIDDTLLEHESSFPTISSAYPPFKFSLCNYIESITTYYSGTPTTVQANEMQRLTLTMLPMEDTSYQVRTLEPWLTNGLADLYQASAYAHSFSTAGTYDVTFTDADGTGTNACATFPKATLDVGKCADPWNDGQLTCYVLPDSVKFVAPNYFGECTAIAEYGLKMHVDGDKWDMEATIPVGGMDSALAQAGLTNSLGELTGAFKGYFALEFTDETGDTWMTEAISVSSMAVNAWSDSPKTKWDVASAAHVSTLGSQTAKQAAGASAFFDGGTPTTVHELSVAAGTPDFFATMAWPSQGYYQSDKRSGQAVAERIEAALEALPNGVLGDVEVYYEYDPPNPDGVGAPVGTEFIDTDVALSEFWDNLNQGAWSSFEEMMEARDRNTETSLEIAHNAAMAVLRSTAPRGAALAAKSRTKTFSISFVSNSGDLPPLRAAYSFVDMPNGMPRTYANANCGTSGVTASDANSVAGTDGGNDGCGVSGFAEVTMLDIPSSAQAAAAGAVVETSSHGTTENAECSNRGLCDYDTGLCKCFSGFAGADCARPDALASPY